jgi:hypothetical protein
MMDNTTNTIQGESDYYRSQFIASERSKLTGDHTMTFIVKDDTDLLQFAAAAKVIWESVGDYPSSFTGIVRTSTGNAFATFQYEGALGFATVAE